MMQGWRASQDDAVIAIRSWGVLTAHSPLLGHDPGNRVQWSQRLLSRPAPVLDPRDPGPNRPRPRGALGAALVAAARVAVCVEAAWAVRGASGAARRGRRQCRLCRDAAARAREPHMESVSRRCVLRGASCMAAWAVGSGRLRWWPVLVVAASMAAETHLETRCPQCCSQCWPRWQGSCEALPVRGGGSGARRADRRCGLLGRSDRRATGQATRATSRCCCVASAASRRWVGVSGSKPSHRQWRHHLCGSTDRP